MDTRLRATAAWAALVLAGVLVGCGGTAPAENTDPAPDPAGTASPEEPGAEPTADPSDPVDGIALPTDCRAILSEDVLAQLEGVPLNHEAFSGQTGVLDDGSLRCIWANPAADTTSLATVISRVVRGPALDLLNDLADDEGFLCYSPDEGTRCEKTWENEEYPVTDGRTLYWRGGILIDTQYSNLAPSGYTASIVESIFGG
ncbi:hypothetical protein [Microbacterium sp. NIBRBAC000506063]|uniref:hypothetical protein n=1 Tax=Microbacterium sp. NIBRBAC000506063 TaxID=2734618 RepID=UPI001CB6C8C7|nr:hypothetical protein [Microbacterium sp. NIBRBAC000506063]